MTEMNTLAPFPKFIRPNAVGDHPQSEVPKLAEVDGTSECIVQQTTPSKLSKPSKVEDKDHGIDALLITLTLAIHDARDRPRPAPALATGRRTSIEDGLAVAKCMDVLDNLAKADISRPELLDSARDLVDTAAALIRECKFFSGYQQLDQIRRLATS